MDRLQIAILKLLLKNDDYITYDFISKRLGVSTRTILRFIKGTDSYLKPFNIEFEIKRRKGVKLIGSPLDLKKLESSLQSLSISNLSNVERSTIILHELFSNKDSVKIYYLSYLLKVSVGTIDRDLENVSAWLEKNRLSLEVLRGSGISVLGDRHHIRQAIVNFLIQNINFRKMPLTGNEAVSADFFNDTLSINIRKLLLNLFDFEGFQKTMKCVNEFDYTLASTFVYEDYLKYIMYINLLLHRTGIDERYEECLINLKLKENDQYLRMREFAKKIKRTERIIIPESDICNLTAIYLSMRPNEYITTVYNYDEDVYQATLRLLDETERDLNIKINRDESLIQRLVTHLKLMVKRIQMGVVINNNYLDTVRKEYPKVFASVKKNIDKFSLCRGIKVSEDEVGYIVVYILANIIKQENENKRIKAVILCMSGFGTGKMLEQSIKNKLPMIDVKGVISIQELNEVELSNCGVDLIISTIKIDTVIIPKILVNTLMNEDDLLALNKKCQDIISKNKIFQRKKFTRIEPAASNEENQGIAVFLQRLKIMYDILNHYHFGKINVENIDELLTSVSREAFSDERVRNECVKKLKYRESLGSTVIDEDGVILFHCKFENEICLHFYSLVNPIDCVISNRLTRISKAVLMVAPYDSDDLLLKEFNTVSEALVQDKELIRLISQGVKEKIFKYLANILFMSII